MGKLNNIYSLLRKNRALQILVIGIFVIIGLFYAPFISFIKNNETLIGIIGAIREALIVAIVFQVVYESYSKKLLFLEFSEKITDAFFRDSQIINRFTPGSKTDIIEKFVKSIHGDRDGTIIFNSFFKRYLTDEFCFRSDYKYHISYDSIDQSEKTRGINFSESDYNLVTESISYAKIYSPFTSKPNSFKIGFVYNENDLEEIVDKDEYFFREVLHLKESDKNKIVKINDTDLINFIKRTLTLSIKLDNNYINLHDCKSIKNLKERGFYIECNIKDILHDKNDFNCEIKFGMPQLKSVKRFLITFPEPTLKPSISFNFHNGMKNVTPIPFFSENEKPKTKPTITPKYIVYEFKNWVLDRSGVLFVWEN